MKKGNAIALVVYGLLCLLLFIPIIPDWLTTIFGSGPDPYQYIWNADTFRQTLLNGRNPFYTDRLAYPQGVSLVMHTYTPIIGLFNVMLNNPYLSCNVALLLSFFFSAYGAFLLSKKYVKSTIACLICGFVFAFSPYKTSHLFEHYHLLLTGAVPFFVIHFMRIFNGKTFNLSNIAWKPLFYCICLFLITLFSDYYTSFFLIFFALVYLLYYSLGPIIKSLKPITKWMLFLVVLIAGHLISESAVNHEFEDKGAFYNTADVASLVIPPANSAVYQSQLFEDLRIKSGYKGPNEQVMFLGFLLMVLLLITLKKSGNKEIVAISIYTLFFLMLCLPKIKFLGNSVTYTPLAWIHFVPFLNNIRNPTRFVAMVYLFLPVVVFYGVQNLRLVQQFRYRPLLYAVLAILVFTEFKTNTLPEINANEVSQSSIILSKRDDVRVVMNVPTGMSDGFRASGKFDPKLLQDQIVHQKKMLGAYISRLKPHYFEQWMSSPIIQYLDANNPHVKPEGKEIYDFIIDHNLDALIIDLKETDLRAYNLFSDYIIGFQDFDGQRICYLDSKTTIE